MRKKKKIELKFDVQRAGEMTRIITVKDAEKIIHSDTIQIFKASAREKFAASICKIARLKLPEILQKLAQIEADERAQRASEATERPQAANDNLSKGRTVELIVDFLKKLRPVYRDNANAIFFEKLQCRLTQSQLSALDGLVQIIGGTDEWMRECHNGAIKPSSELRLVRELTRIAGIKLAATLPLKSANNEVPEISQQIHDALITLLTEPRTLRTHVTPQISYSSWAQTVACGGGWKQCYGHPIYAAHLETGVIQIAARSHYLHDRCRAINANFSTVEQAGEFLSKNGLIENDAGGSKRIWFAGRQLRVWQLAPDIVDEACGQPSQHEEQSHADPPEDKYAQFTGRDEGVSHDD